jgi:DNA-binding LacI/PurR family transcriptional regulator
MTVIAQRTPQIAQKAVDLLERRFQQTNTDSIYVNDYIHSVIDVELIERQSVASLTDVG